MQLQVKNQDVWIYKSVGLSEKHAFKGLIITLIGLFIAFPSAMNQHMLAGIVGVIVLAIGLNVLFSFQFLIFNLKDRTYRIQEDYLIFKTVKRESIDKYYSITVARGSSHTGNSAYGISTSYYSGTATIYTMFLTGLDTNTPNKFIVQFNDWEKMKAAATLFSKASGLPLVIESTQRKREAKRKGRKR